MRLSLVTALCLSLAPHAQAEEVRVFAAASMQTALDQLAESFEAETGHDVVISYAGSNALAKQIIEGAPADIFISAAVNWMDEVEKAELIAEGGRQDLLGNSLVLVGAENQDPITLSETTDLLGLLQGGKLAMALIDAVPAGQYGKAALENLGLWESVAPSVAQSDNVRAALALVATKEAPFGIVYATDAAADPKVSLIATFPAASHPAIIYPAALLREGQDAADRAFFEALSSPKADKIFAEQGFSILN